MNHFFDVIVCGGGPAGFGAAVSAARNGAGTLLIDQGNCLGGTATSRLVIEFAKTAGRNGGIFKEVIDRMEKLGGITREVGFPSVYVVFDPELLKYVLQGFCEEAGVNILFHTFVESAIVENGSVCGVNIVNKSGSQEIRSKVVIDATGDGDAAVSAGARFEQGEPVTHKMQGLTLRIRIGGVDMATAVDWKQVNEQFEKARREGSVNFPYYVTKWLDAGAGGLHGERTLNLDMVTDTDATDAFQLSRAEIDARKRVWEFINFAKNNIPGWENSYIIDSGSHIGVRETRRIMGRYILTEDDVRKGRKFEDGISRASFSIDLHDPDETAPGWEELEEHIRNKSCPPGDYYEIPYRCLLPKELGGILVAGRCISADRRAGGSVRIMNTCMNTGEAAGLAAGIAASKGIGPEEIDGKYLRAQLIAAGAEL
ncbi:MAG: FAD-dependent oxidoreductase [Victivallales bacterium]|nr:FAD-dependent oxidoreductase [Victivallales bacterium]